MTKSQLDNNEATVNPTNTMVASHRRWLFFFLSHCLFTYIISVNIYCHHHLHPPLNSSFAFTPMHISFCWKKNHRTRDELTTFLYKKIIGHIKENGNELLVLDPIFHQYRRFSEL